LETILIKGPAQFKVIGKCEILGAKFSNTYVSYNNNKVIPIEKENSARIIIKQRYRSSSQIGQPHLENDIGTKIWANIMNEILKTKRKKIIILGPVDSGKSTLSIFIANKIIENNLNPIIIDSDIGQGELSPPACIGATYLKKQTIDLSQSSPDHIRFIGNTHPIGYENRIIECIIGLNKRTYKDKNITIINTDGFIQDNEANYKIELVDKINPDCIIWLGHNGETIDLLDIIKRKYNQNPDITLINGNSPPDTIKKSPMERRSKRIQRYSRFLFERKVTHIPVTRKKIKGIYYKNQFHLFENDYEAQTKMRKIKDLFDKNFLLDRFVGLAVANDYENIKGFGLIKNYYNETFIIETSLRFFNFVYLSDIKLNFPSYFRRRFN
jgi:polynucleotide 5'-hydroxyl-kinase GRC3/NOL9